MFVLDHWIKERYITAVSSDSRSSVFIGVCCLLIPTAWGHINKQTPAGIVIEITRFEDTAQFLLICALLLLFRSMEFCWDGLCAISLNSPIWEFFPGNGNFFLDPENRVPLPSLLLMVVSRRYHIFVDWLVSMQRVSLQLLRHNSTAVSVCLCNCLCNWELCDVSGWRPVMMTTPSVVDRWWNYLTCTTSWGRHSLSLLFCFS